MYVKVRNALTGDTALFTLSKLTPVEELRDMIKSKFKVKAMPGLLSWEFHCVLFCQDGG